MTCAADQRQSNGDLTLYASQGSDSRSYSTLCCETTSFLFRMPITDNYEFFEYIYSPGKSDSNKMNRKNKNKT